MNAPRKLIEWRRAKITEYLSQGVQLQQQIAEMLKVSETTINKDIAFLRLQAKENIKFYLDERLPVEYELCMHSLNDILLQAFVMSRNTHNDRDRLAALSLAKDCLTTKLHLLTNTQVIHDAVSFVNNIKKEDIEDFLLKN